MAKHDETPRRTAGARKPKRRQRRHGALPPGFTWRDGRPRWIPQPAQRQAGWKGHDLKDARGAWLPEGEAIDKARKIVDAVAGWAEGEPVPVEFEAFAPPRAAEDGALPSRLDPLSIGALLDSYLGVPGEKKGEWVKPPSREFAKIKNQADRRSKLGRFLDVLCGWPVKPARDAAPKELDAYRRARAKARAFTVFVLEPPPFDPRRKTLEAAPLEDVYTALQEQVGDNMAYGVMTEVSVWLEWCVGKRAIPANWAKLVKRETPDGRIRIGSWDELALLIAAADDLGKPSIGDSIVLGVDLSWSQGDRLAMGWTQISAGNRIKTSRRKTGIKGETPLLDSLGVPRLQQIRERQAKLFGPNAKPTHVIVCETTRQPYKADWYRHEFALVRDHASAMARQHAAQANDPEARERWLSLAETVLTLRDQDLRDTAVTVAYDAGLDLPEIASRTLHSLKRIHDVLEKHYGQVSQHVADRGARKLNAHLKAEGVRL